MMGTQHTRRRFVAVSAGIFFAGCVGDDDRPEPIALHGEKFCDQCGMLIEAHPGPVGQAYFADDIPAGRDGPAWFCSGRCTFLYTFDREAQGNDPVVIYATDYSAVDWSVTTEDGQSFISAHLDAEAFTEVDELVFLVNSNLQGAMGTDLIGFSISADAQEARATYGGVLYDGDEITPELVGTLS